MKVPSLEWNYNPKHPSKSTLLAHRRQQMLDDLRKHEHRVGFVKDSQGRLEDREDCKLRLLSQVAPSKETQRSLNQKRRMEMVNENTSKFGA